MECKYCVYYWQEQDESYPRCHYENDPYEAPCAPDDYVPDDYYGD